jgi:hypothetical protein
LCKISAQAAICPVAGIEQAHFPDRTGDAQCASTDIECDTTNVEVEGSNPARNSKKQRAKNLS